MNFGQAIESLKNNERVSREGWNGKNMYLFLDTPKLSNHHNDNAIHPSICMKTAQDTIVIGWLASQTDMLAEDWIQFN